MLHKRRRLISFLLIFLAFLFGTTTQTGFSFGDKLFLALGISPWSQGQGMFHIITVVAIILLIIACIYGKKEIPLRHIGIFILVLIIFSPPIVSQAKPIYYKMHNGLDAVEYNTIKSSINTKPSPENNNLEIYGIIVLTNYGKDLVKFRAKIDLNQFPQLEYLSEDIILEGVNTSEKSGDFTLQSGETRSILINTSTSLANKYITLYSIEGPKLILFNDNEIKIFGKYK